MKQCNKVLLKKPQTPILFAKVDNITDFSITWPFLFHCSDLTAPYRPFISQGVLQTNLKNRRK